jgi:hypothetical protein
MPRARRINILRSLRRREGLFRTPVQIPHPSPLNLNAARGIGTGGLQLDGGSSEGVHFSCHSLLFILHELQPIPICFFFVLTIKKSQTNNSLQPKQIPTEHEHGSAMDGLSQSIQRGMDRMGETASWWSRLRCFHFFSCTRELLFGERRRPVRV